MIKLLYNLFRPQFLKLAVSEISKPITHQSLEFAYLDTNGKRYYKFPNNSAFPLARHAQRDEYLIWHSRNLSGQELTELIDQMNKAIHSGLKTEKNGVRVAAIASEILDRQNMIVSFDILLNIAAIGWIREDEDPLTFNPVIHQEKVEQFAKEVKEGDHYFFFQQTELRKLYDFQKFSEDVWRQFFEMSEKSKREHKAVVKHLSETQ